MKKFNVVIDIEFPTKKSGKSLEIEAADFEDCIEQASKYIRNSSEYISEIWDGSTLIYEKPQNIPTE